MLPVASQLLGLRPDSALHCGDDGQQVQKGGRGSSCDLHCCQPLMGAAHGGIGVSWTASVLSHCFSSFPRPSRPFFCAGHQ